MDLKSSSSISEIKNLELLARQVVEGFVAGIHKSPFHGFSVEFSEHRLYNKGESTRHIDWKLFAKTDKLYVKRYEEETNLRCHIIIDNSASMHYPVIKKQSIEKLNKIGFSIVAAATLIEILKKQRDAVGLSIYGSELEYYTREKGNDAHRRMLLKKLESLLHTDAKKVTATHKILHLVAEKTHRRSMIFLFTDMFQNEKSEEELFESLRHLKYNKHEVVLFHTYDKSLEIDFDFENTPKKYVDVETGEEINLFSESVRETYKLEVEEYFKRLKNKCIQYKIDYVPVDVNAGFSQVLTSYMISRQRFQ